MIGYLKGTIQFITSEFITILTHGVGYEVYATQKQLQSLTIGNEIEMFVYTYVKEDQLKLFGFETYQEKRMFILLLTISGVGPKAAITIMSSGAPTDIHKAVVEADLGFFTKVKGLGKKTSQKIIIELKSKLGSIKELDLSQSDDLESSNDVIDALVQFGFVKKDIIETLDKLDQNLSEDQIIKQALKYLGK